MGPFAGEGKHRFKMANAQHQTNVSVTAPMHFGTMIEIHQLQERAMTGNLANAPLCEQGGPVLTHCALQQGHCTW